VSLRVLSLFIRYGDADYRGAYQALMAFYAGLPGVEVDPVLIDTALPVGVEARLGRRGLMVAGDNQRREFSGWDGVLERFHERLAEYDLVHLVTSAFQNEYNGFYPLVCREMLDYVHDTPQVMLAHVDAYPERVRLCGRGFQTWGCSKFLFARPQDLLALDGIAGPFGAEDFFPAHGDAPFREGAPLSDNYARFLLGWLTGDGLPHGKWHSVFAYSDENVAKFRAKALSILDEHSLSMRIRESGVRIVDYTWWHANRARIRELSPPDELIQIQERNCYLFGASIVDGSPVRQLPLPAKPGISTLLAEEGVAPFSGRLAEALLSGLVMPPEVGFLDESIARAGMLASVGYQFSPRQLDWLAHISEELEQDAPLPITRGLHAEWLARADLRQTLDLATSAGRQELVAWWVRECQQNASLRDLIPAEYLSETDPTLKQDAPLPITRGLHAEWLARADLRQTLDLATPAGRQELVAWWVRECQQNASLRDLIPAECLSEIDPTLKQDAPLPITRGLHAEWLARADLRQTLDLATSAGRQELVAWWVRECQQNASLRDLIPAEYLSETDPTLKQDAPLPITRGLYAEWLARVDLRQTLDLASRIGREALAVWWFVASQEDQRLCAFVVPDTLDEVSISCNHGYFLTRRDHLLWCSREDLRGAFDVMTDDGIQAYLYWLNANEVGERAVYHKQTTVSAENEANLATGVSGYADGGVNVIGYGRGEFGIGEDVRMAVQALSDVDMEISVPLLPLRLAARQDDSTLSAYEVARPVYRTNLICLPHYETLRLLAATDRSILDKRYNIGFWQWELARFPEAMAGALGIVDEIWSASSFTADSMRAVTDKPVFHMPMVVTLPAPIQKWARQDFSLPQNAFIFLTVLDGNSSLKRKNPLATVRAFLAAFPRRERHVHLVVKAMNVSTSQPEWQSVVEYAGRDDRITLIVETMTKDKLLGLQSVCDCFISLHRSEGFGRNIAEAMLLGKPVIVSDYSGNTDFCNEQGAFLVCGDEIKINRGEYPFGDGQYWFDPNVLVASERMKECREDHAERCLKAKHGKYLIESKYNSIFVGQQYRARLQQIWENLL